MTSASCKFIGKNVLKMPSSVDDSNYEVMLCEVNQGRILQKLLLLHKGVVIKRHDRKSREE